MIIISVNKYFKSSTPKNSKLIEREIPLRKNSVLANQVSNSLANPK
jgi:hypothetical protein